MSVGTREYWIGANTTDIMYVTSAAQINNNLYFPSVAAVPGGSELIFSFTVNHARNLYQYYKSCENLYQVLQVMCCV